MRIDNATCARRLIDADDIHILCHQNPDGDTVGTAFALYYALRALGKRVGVRCADPLPPKFSYFYPEGGYEPDFPARCTVAVDVAEYRLLGALREHYPAVDICIDHHISNPLYARETLMDSAAAAAAEILPPLRAELGVPLCECIGAALYTGIASDTGCFRYSNTTARTHEAAALLYRTGFDAVMVNRLLFETKSRERLALERHATDSLVFSHGGRCAMLVLSLEILSRTGAQAEDIDDIANLPRQISGVEVAVTLREAGVDEYRVSMRSQGVDVSTVCKKFGGGGHIRAAGCRMMGPLEDVKARIMEEVSQVLSVGDNVSAN